MKNVYVDAVVFTPHQLRHLVEVFGADKILMGTDYPYDMAELDPIAHLVSAELDSNTIAAIAGGNVRRLLNI